MNVLLVDDDPGVRKAHGAMLEHAGFQVTAVSSAQEAAAAIEKTAFAALVVDVILPRVEGTKFFDDLATAHPELAHRVLFVTGWTGDPKVQQLLEYTGRPALTKPVEGTALIAAVRAIANQPPPKETQRK
jgi:DNA-binding response OmpR family regulator